MTIDLKAIRAAAEAATPGPWEAAGPSFGAPLPKYLNCVGWVTEDDEFEDVCTAPLGSDGGNSADMAYIATANPATVIALLDRLEAAEKDAARYQHFRRGNRLTVKCKGATVIFGPNTERDYPEQLDAAIDAAMGEQT